MTRPLAFVILAAAMALSVFAARGAIELAGLVVPAEAFAGALAFVIIGAAFLAGACQNGSDR